MVCLHSLVRIRAAVFGTADRGFESHRARYNPDTKIRLSTLVMHVLEEEDVIVLIQDGMNVESTLYYYTRRLDYFLNFVKAEGNNLDDKQRSFIRKAKQDSK